MNQSESLTDRIQRQLKLEEDYISQGYKKVVKRDHENKERHYGSHASIGNLIRRELVGYLASYLRALYKDIEAGKASVGSATIYQTLSPYKLRFAEIAHIGLSTLLDNIFFPNKSDSDIHKAIGDRIEDHFKLKFFRAADADLYEYCEKHYMRQTAGYRQIMSSTSIAFSKKSKELNREAGLEEDAANELTWIRWPANQRRMLGSWIVSASQEVFKYLTGLSFLSKRRFLPPNAKRTKETYCLHDDIIDIELNKQVEAGLCANYQDNPMVCPPVPHTVNAAGGFVTNSATHRYDLVRNRGTSIPSETALQAINNLQNTAWRINTFVLEQLQVFYDKGWSVNESDSFRPYLQPDDADIPKVSPHLLDLKDVELASTPHEKAELTELHKELKREKVKLRDWYNRQADRRRESRIHQLRISTANRFATEERFWIPWSFDFRTRMYPISIMNPQAANYVNGLMTFADGYRFRVDGRITDPKTKHWLAVHVATTKGFSKETFKGREEWVDLHEREITLVATDPLGLGKVFWTEEADEPWTYLAACREYYECFIECSKDETHLPCGLDATASGLQILGALMGDESTCELVNVLPTRKPSDLYQAIIDKTIRLIKDDRPRRRNIPLDQLSRKVAKAPTMTLAYGSTPWRRKKQVQEACNSQRGLDLDLPWEKIEYIASKLDDAIALVLPGVSFTLKWLQDTAVQAMDGAPPEKNMIIWETPSGCVIHQRYFQSELRQIRTIALGMTRYRKEVVHDETEKPNLSKIQSSTAANFVHSLDAAVLQLSCQSFQLPFSLTHDCVYARAGSELVNLIDLVKDAFILVVSSDVLLRFAEINGVPDCIKSMNSSRNLQFPYSKIKKSKFLFC